MSSLYARQYIKKILAEGEEQLGTTATHGGFELTLLKCWYEFLILTILSDISKKSIGRRRGTA